MRVRVLAASLIVAASVAALGLGPVIRPVAGDDKHAPAALAEHEFRGKYLVVDFRSPGRSGEARAIEKASTRRLGDRAFVVGAVLDLGAGYELTKGSVLWIPLSDIQTISEYDSIEAVKKIAAAQAKRD